MRGYFLDTNHLSEAVLRVSPLRERLHREHRLGWRFGVCAPVLCELEAGLCASQRQAALRRNLLHLRKEVIRLWPVAERVAQQYGLLYNQARAAGRALSFVDILAAALAIDMNLTLLTADRDFEVIPELRTENWLQ